MAHSERGGGVLAPRGGPLTRHPELSLVGSVAKLLNAGLDAGEALGAVAETTRSQLRADRVTIWFRDDATGCFRMIAAPAAAGGSLLLESLQLIPADPDAIRFPLEHDEAQIGLLEARGRLGEDELEVLGVVADLLAPFLASLALSADLATEVAAQSREIDEQRRFTGLIIDSLPLGLYVVDREYRIQIWNRQREVGAPGLRRDEVMGRQVFEVLTRQPAEQLRAEFDRVFQTGEIQQAEL
ncbi:MAG: PAS domain-containing protein, partial [Gemmatimonadales bacterium]